MSPSIKPLDPHRRQSHARRRPRAGADRSARGADLLAQPSAVGALGAAVSRLELRFARLVPRRDTRIVLCDDGDGLVERAAKILAAAGYTDLSYLQGGVAAWEKAGLELFSGVNVPSKAFGEHIEHACHTPSISAEELDGLMRSGTDMVVVDSRPFDEFQRVSIPSATNVPGAELVLRIHDIAPSPDTLVVVNCAGRTRSIIGAQSLINAGLPNKVVALRNGTMGWTLAGLMPDSGKTKRFTEPSSDGLAWAKAAAERVAQAVRRHAHRRQGAGELPRRRDAHALCVRRARPDRIRRRPFPRRGQRARRPARPGHRPICRHARRAHRADRRPRGARGDDGVVAQADGLARRVRARRERQREGPAAGAGARRRRRRPSAPSRPRNCPSWWRRTASPWSIFRSARPIARATSPAPGSPSARGCRRRWRRSR